MSAESAAEQGPFFLGAAEPPASPGVWLQVLRATLELTQEELGDRLGYSKEMVRKIEADERNLSRDAAERLADLIVLEGDERSAFLRMTRGELSPTKLRIPHRLLGDNGRNATPIPSPYRGLFAFREQDAPFFFGRETFVEQLVTAVHLRPLAAVIGPSGSGKSSVVFAGLLPRLRQEERWLFATFRPGAAPFDSLGSSLLALLEPQMNETEWLLESKQLAASLRHGDLTLSDVARRIVQKAAAQVRLLLVVDQFEELYTVCQDPQERQRFLYGCAAGKHAG